MKYILLVLLAVGGSLTEAREYRLKFHLRHCDISKKELSCRSSVWKFLDNQPAFSLKTNKDKQSYELDLKLPERMLDEGVKSELYTTLSSLYEESSEEYPFFKKLFKTKGLKNSVFEYHTANGVRIASGQVYLYLEADEQGENLKAKRMDFHWSTASEELQRRSFIFDN